MALPRQLFHLSCILILLQCTFSTTTTTTSAAATPCDSMPDPKFCQLVGLSSNNATANVYDYGRFSVKKSLSSAEKFIKLIEKYLRNSDKLTRPAIGALQDCKLLAEWNRDYLVDSFKAVDGSSNKAFASVKADDILTQLSAILTNVMTCQDGLQATSATWSVRNGIVAPLDIDTKLFRLSLALFTRGWVPRKRKTLPPHPGAKKFNNIKDGYIPMRMAEHNRRLYEKLSGRRLLQAASGGDQVLIRDMVVVSQDGSGDYTNVSDAVAAAPLNLDGSDGYYLIYVTEGTYEEYVSIEKKQKYLMMIGDGIGKTVITGNHNFIDGWTTFNTSTFAVVGQGFIGAFFTVRNTAGPSKHQAVALRNGADLSVFYSCSFEAYQDTLYVHSLRQFYRECDVYGTVDFIFGNAAVVLQNCNLYPRRPMDNQFNAITAQGRTDVNQNTGISIQNCNIVAADDLKAGNSNNGTVPIKTYLGRPWKLFSRTIYMQSYMDNCVDPAGWSVWSGDFALNTSYYAEFNNQGPGSDTSKRVTWPGVFYLNSSDASNFTVNSFLLGDDWIWQTGVPYTSGLSA